MYFGHGTWGIQAASAYYFSKDVSEITLAESAILIGLLPAPAKYSPHNHPERAVNKRNLVLKKMLEQNYISQDVFEGTKSKSQPIKKIDYDNSLAPYFSEYIRRELENMDKELGINIYEDGLNINTTLDMSIQNLVESSFNEVMIKIKNGKYIPTLDKVFPMKDIRNAHEYIENRQHMGKVVMEFDN